MTNDNYCINNTGKGDDGETVSSAKEATGAKRKAGGKTSSKSPGPPQYCHWLMKSEPESRFENGNDMKVQSCSGVISTVCCEWESVSGLHSSDLHLVRSAVRDRRSEGLAWSDRLLGWRPQLSGGATKLKRCLPEIRHQYSTTMKRLFVFLVFSHLLVLSSLCGSVPLNYLSSTGTQFYEADERRSVCFLLPQQLQGTGNSRSREGKSLSFAADNVVMI